MKVVKCRASRCIVNYLRTETLTWTEIGAECRVDEIEHDRMKRIFAAIEEAHVVR